MHPAIVYINPWLDSIRFTIFVSLGAEAIYKMWSALPKVLTKLLTVISLGLAINAQ